MLANAVALRRATRFAMHLANRFAASGYPHRAPARHGPSLPGRAVRERRPIRVPRFWGAETAEHADDKPHSDIPPMQASRRSRAADVLSGVSPPTPSWLVGPQAVSRLAPGKDKHDE